MSSHKLLWSGQPRGSDTLQPLLKQVKNERFYPLLLIILTSMCSLFPNVEGQAQNPVQTLSVFCQGTSFFVSDPLDHHHQDLFEDVVIIQIPPPPPRPQLAGDVSGQQLCKLTAGEIQHCEILHDLSRLQLH